MTSQSEDIIPILTSQDLLEMKQKRAPSKQEETEEDAKFLAHKIKYGVERSIRNNTINEYGMRYKIDGDYQSIFKLLKKYLPGLTLSLDAKDSNNPTVIITTIKWFNR